MMVSELKLLNLFIPLGHEVLTLLCHCSRPSLVDFVLDFFFYCLVQTSWTCEDKNSFSPSLLRATHYKLHVAVVWDEIFFGFYACWLVVRMVHIKSWPCLNSPQLSQSHKIFWSSGFVSTLCKSLHMLSSVSAGQKLWVDSGLDFGPVIIISDLSQFTWGKGACIQAKWRKVVRVMDLVVM